MWSLAPYVLQAGYEDAGGNAVRSTGMFRCKAQPCSGAAARGYFDASPRSRATAMFSAQGARAAWTEGQHVVREGSFMTLGKKLT